MINTRTFDRKTLFCFIFAVSFLLAGASVAAVAGETSAGRQAKIEKLLATYEYDSSMPLNTEIKPIMEQGQQRIYHIEYDSTNGERVPAMLYLPPAAKAPFPCMIVQHGYNGNKDLGGAFSSLFSPRGYAVIAIDIEYHGERKEKGKDVLSTDAQDDVRALHQTIVDLRRTVDYLESRDDIDRARIGYVGASLGSFLGSVFLGVEERVKTGVLIVGGGGWPELFAASTVPSIGVIREYSKEKGLTLEEFAAPFDVIEPLNFVDRISPRSMLMISCSDDKYVPKNTGDALYNTAKEPKDIRWFTCGGDTAHMPPADKTMDYLQKWFGKYL